MKRYLFLLAAIFVVATGCQKEVDNFSKSDFILEDTITLKNQSIYYNSEHDISIIMDSINDSRCPKDVQCIWAGDAAVWFSSTYGNISNTFDLHTHPNFDIFRELDGYVIELIDVRPYPSMEESIEKKDIEVDLVIREK